MNHRVLPLVCVGLLALSACSSSSADSSGAGATVAPGSSSVPAAGDATTSTTTTTAAAASSSTAPAPTSEVPATTAATVPPATTAAPAPPTTTPCRVVGVFPGDYFEQNFTLRRGDCGPAVETLQSYLNDIYGYSLSVDGRFGPATERAVREMQTRFFGAGPAVTGVLDPGTWTAMVGSDPPPGA